VLQILVLHGPNLDRLGTREPERYGATTLRELDAALVTIGADEGVAVDSFQSNWEGALVDRLHQGGFDGVVVNAAGLTHTSVVLRDALLATARPFVEAHLTNVHAREAFRRTSLLADVAIGVVCGFGPRSYEFALRGLVHHLRSGAARANGET
jgi:3-dehydroquinate dehydratase-2